MNLSTLAIAFFEKNSADVATQLSKMIVRPDLSSLQLTEDFLSINKQISCTEPGVLVDGNTDENGGKASFQLISKIARRKKVVFAFPICLKASDSFSPDCFVDNLGANLPNDIKVAVTYLHKVSENELEALLYSLPGNQCKKETGSLEKLSAKKVEINMNSSLDQDAYNQAVSLYDPEWME